jgi:hypothetical protein
MIRQCAWCLHVIGLIPPIENQAVTHGMCATCFRKFLQTHENDLKPDSANEDADDYAQIAEVTRGKRC